MGEKKGGNPGEKRTNKSKDGGSSDDSKTSYKNFAFLCLMVLPSLFWLAAVGGDVISNAGIWKQFEDSIGDRADSDYNHCGISLQTAKVVFKTVASSVSLGASSSHFSNIFVLSTGNQERKHRNTIQLENDCVGISSASL